MALSWQVCSAYQAPRILNGLLVGLCGDVEEQQQYFKPNKSFPWGTGSLGT